LAERREGSTRIIPYRGAEIHVTLGGVWWNFPGERKHEAKNAKAAMSAINENLGAVVLKVGDYKEPKPEPLKVTDEVEYVTTDRTRWKLAWGPKPFTPRPADPATEEQVEFFKTGKSDDCPF